MKRIKISIAVFAFILAAAAAYAGKPVAPNCRAELTDPLGTPTWDSGDCIGDSGACCYNLNDSGIFRVGDKDVK